MCDNLQMNNVGLAVSELDGSDFQKNQLFKNARIFQSLIQTFQRRFGDRVLLF